MGFKNSSGDKVYTLDIPQKEGKEGFIGTFLAMYLQIGSLLRTPEFSKEPMRVYYMTELMISLIPNQDENNRKTIRDDFKNLRIELEKDYRVSRGYSQDIKLSSTETDHILLSASLQILGEVSDYIDEYIGISIKNKVGFVRRQNKEKGT